jgi:hypothetical protein
MADNWYIVQCNPNCERKAVAEIRRAGFRAHMPRLARVRRHHRTKQPITGRSWWGISSCAFRAR